MYYAHAVRPEERALALEKLESQMVTVSPSVAGN